MEKRVVFVAERDYVISRHHQENVIGLTATLTTKPSSMQTLPNRLRRRYLTARTGGIQSGAVPALLVQRTTQLDDEKSQGHVQLW